jgi:hypothetical protein
MAAALLLPFAPSGSHGSHGTTSVKRLRTACQAESTLQ